MENDETMRLEFARVFNWYDYNTEYGYSSTAKKLRVPTWAEIFTEIGKLLERGNCQRPSASGEPSGSALSSAKLETV